MVWYNSAMKYRLFVSSVQGDGCFAVREDSELFGRGVVDLIPFG